MDSPLELLWEEVLQRRHSNCVITTRSNQKGSKMKILEKMQKRLGSKTDSAST